MPNWKRLSAGEIGTFMGGSGFPNRFQGRTSGDIPFFKVSDMNSVGNELFLSSANNYVDERSRKAIGAVLVPKGAIVFAKVGAAVFLERKRILAQPSCIDNNMAALIVRDGAFDVRFVHYLLNAVKLSSFATPGALPSLNSKQLRSIEFDIPDSIEEQRKISKTLGEVDNLISSLDHLVEKKRRVSEGVQRELLLGSKRLSGYSETWESVSLSEVASGGRGAGLSKSSISQFGEFPCLLYGELFTTYGRTIESVKSFTNESSGVLSSGGEVLIPGSTTTVAEDLATASALLQPGVLIGGDVNILRPDKSRVDPSWLAYYLSVACKRQIKESGQGTTIVHVYVKSLLGLNVALPPIAEQRAIARVLQDCDNELALLYKRLEASHAIKRGMLQELTPRLSRQIVRGI